MTYTLHTVLFLFAEAAQAPPKGNPPGGSMQSMMVMFLIIGIVFYLLMVRPQRKQQRQRQEMLAGVKKNDKIVTIGGIFGVVTNVDAEAGKITIRVDESNNVKLEMSIASIHNVITDKKDDEGK